ncbi:DUF3349 domain-containing protein [Nocardioides hwasunensis]|uniref:DUF3349 domain-containing protein n=1 Tax=Nocardioides hwasunensis TaxID=397258 RepID=A0ABR8MB63_9ACTN|nr:DUF3349 domain-containing protein [Nocardioides hwasunensis]MBD3913193.1 DUF3349 domain-containing protein [Nocardioides hwasunensis]
MPVLLNRVVAWLREGYPTGVPAQDYVALLALLRRRLTDEEVAAIATELADEGMLPADGTDIAVSITKVTDEVPSEADVERVQEHLAFRGFPGADQT